MLSISLDLIDYMVKQASEHLSEIWEHAYSNGELLDYHLTQSKQLLDKLQSLMIR